MIERLDEIGKNLMESNNKLDFLTDNLLKVYSKAERLQRMMTVRINMVAGTETC